MEQQKSLADQWAEYSQKLTPQQQYYLNSQALNGGQGNQFTPQQMQYLQTQQYQQQLLAQPTMQYMENYAQYQQPSYYEEEPQEKAPSRRFVTIKNGKKKKDRAHPYGNGRQYAPREPRNNEPIENTYMSGSYSCKTCKKDFTSEMMYQSHMQAHKK
jgi:Zinc-finger of C2H2 type